MMVSVRGFLGIRWKEWLGHLASWIFNMGLCQECCVWVYLADDQLRWVQTMEYHSYWNSNSIDAEAYLDWNQLSDICHTMKGLHMKITDINFFNLSFFSPFLLMCVMVKKIYLLKTWEWLSRYLHTV
jgi:hypothetical protein